MKPAAALALLLTLLSLISIAHCARIPESEGVSAPFAGTSDGIVLFAGGADFPDAPVRKGGEKAFYNAICTTDGVHVGTLPHPIAYGASMSTPYGILCAGGCNNLGPSKEAFFIQWDDKQQKAFTSPLPPLPVALDNTSGAFCMGRCYIVGGNADGIPSNRMFSLDPQEPEKGWRCEPDFPGSPRIQTACAAQGNRLYVFGGFAPQAGENSATITLESLCFNPSDNQWSQVATPIHENETVSLGGAAAASVGDSLIYCMGGVNKTVFLNALNGKYGKRYLKHAPSWYRFNQAVLVYNVHNDRWSTHSLQKRSARAGAALVPESPSVLWLLQGEVMPGIRTRDNWKIFIETLNNHA